MKFTLTRNLQQTFEVEADSLDLAKAAVYTSLPSAVCTFERDTLEGRQETLPSKPVPAVPAAPVTTAPKVIPDSPKPLPDVIRHMQEQKPSQPTPV